MKPDWIKAKDIPAEWEGTHKLCYNTERGVHFATVTPGFSRIERHCFGWWYAEIPSIPEE